MNSAKVFAIVLGLVLALGLALLAPSRHKRHSSAVGCSIPRIPRGRPAWRRPAGTLSITAAGGGKYTSVSEATIGGMTGRSEITFSVDGKDYAVTTTPAQPGAAITQSIARESDTVYKSDLKLNGQLIATAVTEISGDGKTLTQTTTGVGQFAALSGATVFQRK